MTRKKKPHPILESLTVTDIAAEGKAIVKYNDKVIFVPFVVPGDVVDLQITKKKSRYMEARAIKFHSYAELREDPICEHFGICGGCKWQHLPYAEQIRYKQQQVLDNFERIAKISLPAISPILGASKTAFYRNKLEFTFSNKRWMTYEEMDAKSNDSMDALGFHIPGLFDKVLDIKKCWLQEDISNHIRIAVKAFAVEHALSFFDLRKQEGFLRNLIIRTSSTGDLMIIVVFFYEDVALRESLLQYIANTFPSINSLLYIINSKANDTITDREVFVFKGDDCIYEEMEGLRFKIGPKSFYQTNSEQAYNLYKIVRSFAQLNSNELVYDLYTGTGTIANFIAKECKQVIGIEFVPEAIEDAKVNSTNNQLDNTLFFAGDMKDILNTAFIEQYGKPDVIITDPPRAGMHTDVIEAILVASPQRIVYVSCNPATQARDLALLDAEYVLKAVQPVDMFPHTHHVENVVLLEKRN